MGLIVGFMKFLIKFLLYFAIFATIIVLIPNLPPYTKFTSIKLEPTQERTGPLAPNGLLNNAEKLYEGKLDGPEAFAIYNGELYTSLETGEIVKISPGGHVTYVTKIGQPCSGITQEHICGRPLGIQINERTNTLYIADAYHGIWKVDMKRDRKELLVSPRVPLEGKNPKFFNSIALTKNADIYWTDSSSDFQLKDGFISCLSDPSGRLFYYDAAKNQSKLLLDNIWFANGLVISNDNQFIVVAETGRYRLIKYYIDGPKKGKSEVFVAGLPGAPDNIRVLPDGSGLLVGLYTVFDDEHPLILRSMVEIPLIRKFIVRLQRLLELPFEYLNNMYPHYVFENIVFYIGNFRSVSTLSPPLTGLLQLDWNGNIVASYFNTDKSLKHISDAIVYNGKLYMGSPHSQNFIGAVPAPPLLLKAFSVKQVQESKSQTQEAPKPEVKKEVPKATKPVLNQPPPPTPQAKPPPTEKQTQPPKTPATIKPETKPTPSEKPKPSPKPETKTTPKPESKPTPAPKIKSETKPTPKPETKTTPKPETKTTPKPETKQAPKTETKPTPKTETKTTAPDTKSTPKTETKPTVKPEVKPSESPKPITNPNAVKQDKVEAKKSDKKEPAKQEKPITKPSPIKENIPSDTKKPNEEKLKVIKKNGPTEIPNPAS